MVRSPGFHRALQLQISSFHAGLKAIIKEKHYCKRLRKRLRTPVLFLAQVFGPVNTRVRGCAGRLFCCPANHQRPESLLLFNQRRRADGQALTNRELHTCGESTDQNAHPRHCSGSETREVRRTELQHGSARLHLSFDAAFNRRCDDNEHRMIHYCFQDIIGRYRQEGNLCYRYMFQVSSRS